MAIQLGEQTVKLEQQPCIVCGASIVGPKEGKGFLGEYFDVILEDVLYGENTWEKAESKILKETIKLVVKKAKLELSDIRYIYAGDLLNQLIGSTFALRELGRPFFGLYGACSTMGESMILGSMSVESGFSNYCIAATSSHFCGAEKQFRYPLEYGAQRGLASTWTVTGSGAVIIGKTGVGPKITHVIPGKIIDLGVKDPMNMGAAMAPAAADTMSTFFKDTGMKPSDFDVIATGDLGIYGREIVIDLMKDKGFSLDDSYIDCGVAMFDSETQDTNAGGSGCGCAAATLTGYLLEMMKKKEINKLLFMPTGALLSTVSTNQGESIPGISHGVVLENV